MHVYISHSRENSSTAFRLCEALRKRGVETWFDGCDLHAGEKWDQTVSAAIGAADGFVFLIGPPGPTDRWQTFEWQQIVNNEYYLDASKPLIPVLIGNPELPGFLKTRQALTLDTGGSVNEAVERILDALKDPAISVDQNKLAKAHEARRRAERSFREYSETLAKEGIRSAGIAALE